jgi:hypothetical protein
MGAASRAKQRAIENMPGGHPLPLTRNGLGIPHQPKNTYISLLANQQAALEADLCQALKSKHATQIGIAREKLMDMLFTLSSMILDESLDWKKQDPGLTFPITLYRSEYYQETYFGTFVRYYHLLRNGARFDVDANDRLVLTPVNFVAGGRQEHDQKFYQEGHSYRNLRLLFNDLCLRADYYAPNPSTIQDPIISSWPQYQKDYLNPDAEGGYRIPRYLNNERSQGGP